MTLEDIDSFILRGPYMLAPPGGGFNGLEGTTVVARHSGSFKPEPAVQPPLFRCSHCRSKFSNFGGSCPNCGSADSTILWLPGSRQPAY